MAFPRQFLDELVSRCDIVDVVSSYVALQHKGSNYFGLCPFHNEKTGSFSVSPDKQIYYCFGCKRGGGVINFIMEEENLPFPDAVRFLAKRAGMEVPEEDGDREAGRKRQRLLDLNRDAARFYYQMLQQPEGRAVQEYLDRRKIRRALGPSKPEKPAPRHMSSPASRAGMKFTTTTSLAAQRPNQRYGSFL